MKTLRLAILSVLAVIAGAVSFAQGPVVGIQPVPTSIWCWDSVHSIWQVNPNSSTLEAAPFGASPVAWYGFNPSLGQYTPYLYNNTTGQCTDPFGIPGISSVSAVLPIQVNNGQGPITSGAVTISCQNGSCGGSGDVASQITPPVAGQYVVLYPNSAPTITTGTCVTVTAAATFPWSGSITRTGSGSFGGCLETPSLSYTGTSLPAGITASQVTAVYGAFVAQTICAGNSAVNQCGIFSGAVNGSNIFVGGTPPSLPLGTYSLRVDGGSPTTFNFATVNWIFKNDSTAVWSGTGPFGGQGTATPALIVYYTGTPVSPSGQLQIAPPLNVNQGVLSLPLPFDTAWDTGSSTAYTAQVSGYGPISTTTHVWMVPLHTNTSTTPTFSLNGGSALTIVGPGGSALCLNDIVSGVPAELVQDSSGHWRDDQPQACAAFSLTTTGSSGPATYTSGVLNIPVYAGSSGSPGGSNGQFQFNATGSFAGTSSTYYAQAADTLTSIAALCGSNKIIYVVDIQQTFTLSGNTSLNACVSLQFTAEGQWTVNGASDTLTISGAVSGPPTQHFTGSAAILGSANTPLDNPQWFGAAMNCSTDDSAALQDAINFEGGNQAGGIGWGATQLLAGCYLHNTGLAVSSSAFSLLGTGSCDKGTGTCATTLETSSASINQLTVEGTSGSYINGDHVEHVQFYRSASPTGTATGLFSEFTFQEVVNDVFIDNAVRGFYIANVGAGGTGVFENSQVYWSSCGTTYGFYVDVTSGSTPSLRVRDSTVGIGSACATNYGFYATGGDIQDIHVTHLETGLLGYGIYLNSTSSAGLGNSDNHFWNFILDGCQVSCIYVTGITASGGGSVEFNGGWVENDGAHPAIDIESSSGVTVSNIHSVPNPIHSSATQIVKIGGGTANSVVGNHFLLDIGSITGVLLSSTSDNTVSSNTIQGGSGSDAGISLVSGTYNTITANTLSGTMSTGLSFDSASNNNTAKNLNTVDPTSITTPVSDSGAGNLLAPTWPASGDLIISGGPGNQPSGLAEIDGDCAKGMSGAWTAGSCGGSGGSFQYSALPAVPAVSGFTWVNQQSGSTDTQTGGANNPILLNLVGTSALNWQMMLEAVPGTTPWRVSAFVSCTEINAPGQTTSTVNSSGDCGLYVTNGTTTGSKLEGIEVLQQATSTLALTQSARVQEGTNFTTAGSTLWGGTNGSLFTFGWQKGMYLAWCYNGTDLYAETSLDGVNWSYFNEDTGPFLTPTDVGFGGLFASSTNVNELVSLQGWQSQTVVSCP